MDAEGTTTGSVRQRADSFHERWLAMHSLGPWFMLPTWRAELEATLREPTRP